MKDGGIKGRIKSLSVPEWCCAVRFNSDGNTFITDNTADKFTVLDNSYRYWTADPFVVKENNRFYLFFEMYDRLKRKGLLGFREIAENYCGKMHIIYESSTHLSYPYIYKKDGVYYIIPESADSRELYRLKCTDFPYKWEKEKVITSDKRLADTTPVIYRGKTYYISEITFGNGVFDRIDLFYDDNGCFTECKNNPVKRDVNTARCAGRFFEYRNKLIRPSQDCGKFYGEKLNFNEVTFISEETYEEKLMKTVSVSDIKLDRKNDFVGIHTYNRCENVEVIDLKIPKNFNALNIIGAVAKRIKKHMA